MCRPFHTVLPLCVDNRYIITWSKKVLKVEKQIDFHTYLVASLPFKGDFAQTHMHNVVIGFGCAAHPANNIAVSQRSISLFLKGADGSVYHVHWILTCSCVCAENGKKECGKKGIVECFFRVFQPVRKSLSKIS